MKKTTGPVGGPAADGASSISAGGRLPVDPLDAAQTLRREAQHVLSVLANTGHPFTVDTLTQLAGYPPTPQMLGSVLGTAKQTRLIEVAGATIVEGRLVRVWRGVPA